MAYKTQIKKQKTEANRFFDRYRDSAITYRMDWNKKYGSKKPSEIVEEVDEEINQAKKFIKSVRTD